MSRSTISTFKLFELFPDEPSARKVMKRGMHGVYHHADKKHMGRYVNEFTFRLNQGNVSRHTTERLDSFVEAVAGKRLTFEALTR
jgi:hypothetical protein